MRMLPERACQHISQHEQQMLKITWNYGKLVESTGKSYSKKPKSNRNTLRCLMLDDPNETPNKVQAPSTLSGVKPLMSQSSKKKGHQHDCNSDIFFSIFIQLVSLPRQLWNLRESSSLWGEPFSPPHPQPKKQHLVSRLKKYPFHCKNGGFSC